MQPERAQGAEGFLEHDLGIIGRVALMIDQRTVRDLDTFHVGHPTLPWATALVAMSSTIGMSSDRGTTQQKGLVDMRRSRPANGETRGRGPPR